MTQVSSTKKGKSFFSEAMRHNFSYNVKDNMKLMIVIFVLHFAAAPLLLITMMTNILTTSEQANIDEGFGVAAVIGTGLAAAAGMICALSVFKYLYNKSAVDMRLSLPMTGAQRFVSDFLSGLFVYIVPYFAAELISWLIMLAGHILCDGKTFTFTVLNQYGKNEEYSWVCTIFEEIAPYLWRGMLGGLMLMIMFYAVTVLTASCCGNIFESAAYNILLNSLVPLSVFLGIEAVCNNINGLNEDIYLTRVLPYCGPFGGAFGLVYSLETLDNETRDYYNNSLTYDPLYFGVWLILFTLCTAAVIAGAYLIYRKRKAEDTGKPVVFGIFHHIIMTLGIFTLCYLMMIDGTTNFVPVIVISFIIYMVMHVIRNRGFGKVLRGLAACALTILLSIGSFLVIHETKAFGAGEYVPAPEKVKKAEISYSGIFTTYDGTSPSVITDPAVIENLTQLHSEIINDESDKSRIRLFMGFEIKYTLSSGKTVYRIYNSGEFSDKAIELLSAMDMSEEIKKNRAESIKNDILKIEDTIVYREKENSDFSRSDLYTKLSPQWRYSVGGKELDGSYQIGYNELPSDFLTRFGGCMYDDIMAQTAEEHFTPDGNTYEIEIFGAQRYYINDTYKSTVAYLASCGFNELPVIPAEAVEKMVHSKDNFSFTMISDPLMSYMTGRDILSFSSFGYNANYEPFPYKNGSISPADFTAAYEYYDDIHTLLVHSCKAYKTDESCYTITVGGNSAVIPSEYSSVAERVFIRMTADKANYLAEQDFWDSPYENDSNGNNYNGYSEYLRSFLEFYGKDKIISALSFYYDSEAAEKTYADLTEWSKTDTDFNDNFGSSYEPDHEVSEAAEAYEYAG